MKKTFLFFDITVSWAGHKQIGFHCSDPVRDHIFYFIREKRFFKLIEEGMEGIIEQDVEAPGYTIVTWSDFYSFAERQMRLTEQD